MTPNALMGIIRRCHCPAVDGTCGDMILVLVLPRDRRGTHAERWRSGSMPPVSGKAPGAQPRMQLRYRLLGAIEVCGNT